MFDEPNKDNKIKLFAANDIPKDKTFRYTVTRVNDNTVVTSGNATVSASDILELDTLVLDSDKEDMFLIEWECDGNIGRNHFISDVRKLDYSTYIDFLNKTNLGHFEGF